MQFITGLKKSGWFCLLAAGLGASTAWSQAAAPAQTPIPAGMVMGTGAETPQGMKAIALYSLADRWGKIPDLEGSGPFPASYAMAPDGLKYVVYAPKNLDAAKSKAKLGVYIWGNGGCGTDGAGARFHLTEIASRGYIAIAPGSIESGPKALPPSAAPQSMEDRITAEKMLAALDWILAENKRSGSPYFGVIDPSRVAFSGHSCGGLIAMKASFDPRAKALIMEDSGVFKTPMPGPIGALMGVKKEELDKLHTPVLYLLGGPADGAEPNGLDDFERIHKVPVFVGDHLGVGHFGSFYEPYGEATKIEIDWLQWHFDGNKTAARTFTGPDCTLCRDFRWVVSRKGIQ